MLMQEIRISTKSREEIADITGIVAEKARKWMNGAVLLFCQHTTCGLTINESADPDVKKDLIAFFRQIAPISNNWLHREGNTDAHIRASLLGASLLIPLQEGSLCLGTWQSIYLYEGDGPRIRTVLMQHLSCGA